MAPELGSVPKEDEISQIFRELEMEARRCISGSGFGKLEIDIQHHEIVFTSMKLGKKHGRTK